MKSKLDIINETAEHYTSINRGQLPSGGCCYETREEDPSARKRCAVGRCMTEDAILVHGNYSDYISSLNAELDRKYPDKKEPIQVIFKDEYKGHEVDFWQELQKFHDNHACWDMLGITERGLFYKQQLIDKWVK